MIGKVLVVAYYFPPMGLSGVQRTLKFVKYLPENNWEPIVLTTADPVYYAFDESLLNDINGKEITVFRTPNDPTQIVKKIKSKKSDNLVAYPSRFKEKIRKVVSQTIFQPDSRIRWRKYALDLGRQILRDNEIDVIYATAPPFTDFLVALELAKEFKKPFVLDYRDLWLDNAYYYYTTPFHRNYAEKLETRVLNSAEKSIVTSRGMKEKLIKRYPFLTFSDVSIIPHGFDSEDFSNLIPFQREGDKFVLTHSGLFPDDLTPEYFLKATALFLEKHPEAKRYLELRFVGLMRKKYFKQIKKLGLEENVKALGYLPHSEALRELISADVLWMMIPNDVATPSRLYEYIGSLKPIIICSPKGFVRQTALDSGAAQATEAKDIPAIAQAIEYYYKLWLKNSLPKIPAEYAAKFDRKYLTTLLAKELNTALSIETKSAARF